MLHLIDALHLNTPNVICVAVLQAGDGTLVMIDCGPETVFENVVRELNQRGLGAQNVKHLLATHIHLDHNGGAWRWQREFGTTVHVHPVGAPHMIDPGKLVASATRIYSERMGYLWGEIQGLPATSVAVTADGQQIKVSDLELSVLETPGHAQHHNAYWFEPSKILFAGDVAGVVIGKGPVFPPCPPPDVNIEKWKESLNRVRALNPAQLFLTHFGLQARPDVHLTELETRLMDWAVWMKERMLEGKSEEKILPEFQRFTGDQLLAAGASPADLQAYEQADPAGMSVTGLCRYWRKHHPELLLQA
ncbi:MAG: MBL fold metallo-hydrolase [Verrucomicrobia bacterium]|nr:MBL fold metallo-hydrolase [Verrucomicrobiota bacterium]MBV8483682.1 MBL fold metallo-hydrolase [Verrucomicrobiota bacterium]